jgi:hypothetical protein
VGGYGYGFVCYVSLKRQPKRLTHKSAKIS